MSSRFFAISLILVAANLRIVFSSLSVVLPEIVRDTSLNSFWTSWLTTLPVICLGIFSFPAAGLARRYGSERMILVALLLIALGTALRGFGDVALLFSGSLLAGAGIAVISVLLPSIVKRDFPKKISLMTGFYTMALCGGAAAGAAFTVPLERFLSGKWPLALAAWSLPAFAAAILWTPYAVHAGSEHGRAVPRVSGLLRDPLAWRVTLFMGLQGAMAYIVFGWSAPMLRERGVDGAMAGTLISLSIIVQTVACLAAPALAMRCRDQRGLCIGALLSSTVGFAGLYLLPLPLVWVGAILTGVGQGALIALALILIIMRSPDTYVAARLSGMAQGFGYILAGAGPMAAGLLRGITGNFTAPALLYVFVALLACWSAWGAGQSRHVKAHVEHDLAEGAFKL